MHLVWKYIRYFFAANTIHDAHSAFIHRFIKFVFHDANPYPDYVLAEQYRKKLLLDNSPIEMVPLGAKPMAYTSTVRQIVRITGKPFKYAKVLYLIMQYAKPQYALELGTSCGVSTFYIGIAMPGTTVYTVDGNAKVSNLIARKFRQQNIDNVKFIQGMFDDVLPPLLAEVPCFQFVFLDGNHTYEATIKYFEMILPKLSANAVVVIDDINWSTGMQRAWQYICQHGRTTLCVDIFMMGIVFVNPALSKQTFVYRY